MERDNPVNDDIVFDGNFNSHAHVERDRSRFPVMHPNKHFNSHAHVERDYNPIENYSMTENFNSHAHVERDL